MPYITVDGLEWRFGAREILQLSDRDRDGVADLDVLATAIYDVDSMINAHLASRYALPITPVPDLLKWIAAQLVRCNLHDDKKPKAVQDNCDKAIEWLVMLASGEIDLVDVDGVPIPQITPPTGGSNPAAGGAQRRVTAEVLDSMP